jgi:hypothetical protein
VETFHFVVKWQADADVFVGIIFENFTLHLFDVYRPGVGSFLFQN